MKLINDNYMGDSQNLSLKNIPLDSNVIYMVNHQEGFSYGSESVPEQLTMIALPQGASRKELLEALYHFLIGMGYHFSEDEYIAIVKDTEHERY